MLSSIELTVLLVNLTFLFRFNLLLLRLLFFFGLFLLPANIFDFTLGLVLTLAGLRVVVVVGATNSSISSTYSATSSGMDVLTGICGIIFRLLRSVVVSKNFCWLKFFLGLSSNPATSLNLFRELWNLFLFLFRSRFRFAAMISDLTFGRFDWNLLVGRTLLNTGLPDGCCGSRVVDTNGLLVEDTDGLLVDDTNGLRVEDTNGFLVEDTNGVRVDETKSPVLS